MKSLFTLFVSFLGIAALAQNPLVPVGKAKTYKKLTPGRSFSSYSAHPSKNGVLRSAGSACDTDYVIDYNTYNEVLVDNANNANNEGLTYHGSWNCNPCTDIREVEVTSFVDTSHANTFNDYLWIEGAWDSLAFVDINTSTLFSYPLSASTVYLDSLIMYMGIDGDTTVADGKMTHDSLVFRVYAINNGNIAANPVKTVVFSGYAGLAPFIQAPGYLYQIIIGIHQQFSQGQGFAVKMQYMAKDTSSHLYFTYSYEDSCQILDIEGTDYESFAYPTSFYVSSIGQLIVPTPSGTSATTQYSDDTYSYYQAFADTIPINCSFVLQQNWEFLPMINVCVDYGVQIQAAPTSGCPGSTITLNANLYGSAQPSTGYTYTWNSSAGPSYLNDLSGASTSISMPDSGNVTVYVTASDGLNGNVVDSFLLINNAINVDIAGANPQYISCNGAALTLRSQISGVTAGKTYLWNNVAGSSTANISVSQPGNYSVTVANSDGCTASTSVNVAYQGVTNQVSFTTAHDSTCVGEKITFTNTSTDQNSAWTSNWYVGFGNLYTSTGQTFSYTYTAESDFGVYLQMDSGGCQFTSPTTTIVVLQAGSAPCSYLSVGNVDFNNSVSLLPNPSNGNVNVIVNGVEGNISINVYNILGEQVSNYSAANVSVAFAKTFDFGSLADGTYIVKIQTADKTAIKKLIISK